MEFESGAEFSESGDIIEDGTYDVAVDRIEESIAVLLIEDDDERNQLYVKSKYLPNGLDSEGDLLEIQVQQGKISSVSYKKMDTENRKDSISSRFEELSKPLSSREE